MGKRTLFITLAIINFLLVSNISRAQSLKDLFNNEKISNIINTVTNNKSLTDISGTWDYIGSAIKLESDNKLMEIGGSAAMTVAENQLDDQLNKIGITNGQMSFTFNADSTFTNTIGKHTLKGRYNYNSSEQKIELKYMSIIPLNANIDYTSETLKLLFKSDKLLQLLSFIADKSNNNSLKAIGSLAETYEGMQVGFKLKKQ